MPAEATLKQLAATIKACWICEQAYQQMKEELGLDHFEGRSWTGLHRHTLTTMKAYAFNPGTSKRWDGKKNRLPDASVLNAEGGSHYASRIPGLTLGGLGDRYTKETGHRASDPKHWKYQIDFALRVARKKGWGAWHGRYGTRIGV